MMSMRLYKIKEVLDDVWVRLELFEDGYFSHGGGWNSFVLIFELDLLKGYNLFGVSITSLEDDAIGSLTDGLNSFVVVHFSILN
jgi:hypothetical protein